MRGLSTEFKVGAFALVVLAVLGVMTFKAGGLEWARRKGYTVYVNFRNTAGLDEKTKVKIAGVDAGVIDGVSLDQGIARVTLRVDSGIKIYRNARASVKSLGLLGDKFLAIDIGTPDQPQLKDGDTIQQVTEIIDVDELARNLMKFSDHFGELTKNLNEVLGSEESKRSLTQTIINMREVTAGLNRTIDVNDQKLRRVLDNIDGLTASLNSLVTDNRGQLTDTLSNMKEFSSSLKMNGPDLVDNLNRAAKELRALVEENRPAVKQTVASVDSIVQKIDRGEGSLGRLVKDDSLYTSITKAAEGVNKTLSAVDRFRTYVTFQAEYLTKPKDGKGYFLVTLQPRPDKYYILGVSRGPIGIESSTQTTITPPGTTVTEDEVRKKITFTAQFAKRFDDLALRIGVTENTFGTGMDYFLHKNRLKFSVDAWDFGSNEEGSKRPHVKAGLDYFVFKDVFISAGMDNILNKKWRGGYVGMGVRFEDEDLKYLFGTLPSISTK